MQKSAIVALALVTIAFAAPMARAEDWPPLGQERVVAYYTGTCGVSMTYSGAFVVDCNYDDWYNGTRSGKWRKITDTYCDTPGLAQRIFEVCVSGSSCSASSGTWQEISEAQFDSNYCP